MSMPRIVEHIELPDDTDEDLVGTDWHQRAIVNLYDALVDLSLLMGVPWHVGNQLPLLAWSPSGSVWRPSPDIMVHPHAGPRPRKEMVAREDGIPALIVEVASDSTWRRDVNTATGKAAGYLALGVPAYLVFDPTSAYLGAPCHAWQQEGGAVREWLPASDGRYECRSLGISLRPEGVFLRVYDPTGRPVATREERLQELATLRAELAHLRQQIDGPESDRPGGAQAEAPE